MLISIIVEATAKMANFKAEMQDNTLKTECVCVSQLHKNVRNNNNKAYDVTNSNAHSIH